MSFSLNRMAVSLALTMALAGTSEAWAQQGTEEPSPNVTVQARPRPDYDPLGIRAGSFMIFPSISLSGQYDTNVFADEDEDSDVTAIISPRVTAQSNWSRHALGFGAGLTGAANYEYQSNDYLDAFLVSNGQLEITRDDLVSGFLRVDRLHEGRDDPDSDDNFDLDADDDNRGDLNRYWLPQADVQYRHNFARFFTVVGGSVRAYRYEDVGDDSDEDQRDRNEYAGRARLGFELSPRINLFAQGAYSYRDYDRDQNYGGEFIKRNSTGYQARVGTEVDITGILFGEMALTYSMRDFDENQFKDTQGFGGNGSLTWNITPLTTIILDLNSEIAETTVQFQGDVASSRFENSVGLDVTHELLRNVLLNANTSFQRDDFEDTARTDHIWRAGAGVTYLINRNLSLDANYEFSTRASDAEGARYDRNLFLVGITARL